MDRQLLRHSDAGTGGARGATGPPIFGRSVNPIQTKIMPAAKLMYDDFITSSTGWG